MGDSDSVPTYFVEEPSQHLKCPVCHGLYTDPVINIQCGHTFCKACAHSISQCPLDGSACDTGQMVVNRLVVGQIEDLLIYCRYGLTKEENRYVPDPSGCQKNIHLGQREAHENECKFVPTLCPNGNSSCGRFRKAELDEHLKVCIFTPCEHKNKGCEFTGRREEAMEHEKVCGYRGFQKSVSQQDFEDRSRVFEESNRDMKEQMITLGHRVQTLETEKLCLQKQLQECNSSLQDLRLKYDNLASTVEQLVSVRNRRSYNSPANSAEGRTSSASSHLQVSQTSKMRQTQRSFRKSRADSPPSSTHSEKWKMPFQFKCLGTLRGHKKAVWCLTSYKNKLYSAGSDCLIKVWDLEDLERGCIKTIQGHTAEIQAMVSKGHQMFTGGHGNSIHIWSLDTHSEISQQENAHDNIISSMAIVGDYLFTASFSLIKVWELKTMTLKHTISGLHHWVRALALNPERDKLFSGSHNTIDIWDVREPFGLRGKVEHTFGSVYSLAITNKYIIAGTYNQNIQVFNLATYQYIQQLMGHIGTIHSVVASPSGRFLFSASVDSTVQVWNLENLLPIQTLQRHTGSVNTLFLYGDYLFSGSEDSEIKVFKYSQMQMGFAQNP